MRAFKTTAIVLTVILVIGVGFAVSGISGSIFFFAFNLLQKPTGSFDPLSGVAAPDYSKRVNWAALPDMQDPADLVPAGVEVKAQGSHAVDVFFIHPTGFLTSGSWTSPMDPNSGTEENTRWMMANQASAFNGCCNVYAPRYREANIFAYFAAEAERDAILGFAFEDVKRAFEHYLEHENNGRAFIIASHSQGTLHAMQLMTDMIDTSQLHERMVAAYMIGGALMPLSPKWFAQLNHITPCESAIDLGCIMHWDTMPEGAAPIERPAPSLCTNPLTWRVDEEPAAAALNEGAVVPEGTFNSTIGKAPDQATGQSFEALAEPLRGQTGAACRSGSLFAERQTHEGFTSVGSGMLDSYHELDYALFYMNIHNNARLRTKVWLDKARNSP